MRKHTFLPSFIYSETMAYCYTSADPEQIKHISEEDGDRMKTSRRVIIFCLLAAVALSCESAYQELKSLNDLKNIDFGRSVPKHSLLLLHWFANTVDINNNGVVRLTFDPNTEEFGSHHYGNFEGLLDPLPPGRVRYRYYTVGNLHTETSNELPDYVRNPPLQDYSGTDRDHII